jgi:uncharacterized membrane protein (DUF485 family)
MVREKGILKSLFTSSSLLLVIILALVVLYAQSLSASSIFPQNVEGWNRILTLYLVVFGLVLTGILIYSPRTLRALVKQNYWKSFFISFVPNFIIASIFLISLKLVLKGADSVNIFQAVQYMPLSVLFVHLFVVSQVEEIMFKGLIYNSVYDKSGNRKSANIVSILTFSIWHYAKTGGSIPAMITYIPLRIWFNYVSEHGVPLLNKWKIGNAYPFGATPRTCQAGASHHFVWNMFILSMIAPFRV